MVCSKECSVAVNSSRLSASVEIESVAENFPLPVGPATLAITFSISSRSSFKRASESRLIRVLSSIPRQDCERALVGQCDVHGRSI